MAKADPTGEIYVELSTQAETCSTIEQLQSFGLQAWRKLVPLLHGVDPVAWDQYDAILWDASKRIANSKSKTYIERAWHHCHYIAPQPAIGDVVHVRLPRERKTLAAHVTGHLQQYGSLELAFIRGPHDHTIPQFIEPITHASHPQHDGKELPKWDYPPLVVPKPFHWDFAKSDIAKREKNHIEALAREEQIERENTARQRAAKKEAALA